MVYPYKEIESKFLKIWEKTQPYKFELDSEKIPYTIDNPPRYASGALHVGHAVHYTHIDFVARYKRLRGYNVAFPLCFDCNGIPVEEKVERNLGITRKDIPRSKFVKLCKEFADKNIDNMINQFMRLGCSMDSSIYYRTDDETYRKLTQISFIKLYKSELIYKGTRPVNWCTRCMTALADAEIQYKTRETMLNYINFKSSENDVTIATTRPELLSTCQLVGVSPNDDKNIHLVGKTIVTPIYGREVKVVADDNIDKNFGTGVVMICSIGDKDDLDWITRYNLNYEIIINEEGRLTEHAGKYKDMKIIDARNEIIKDLKEKSYLVKQEKTE